MEQSIKTALKNIFPQCLYGPCFEKINISQLNELRLRANKPVVALVGANSYFVSENGITNEISNAIVCKKEDIENIVFRASECSIYAVNDQIKKGFLTIEGGVRIGLAGTGVCNDFGEIKTIKNFCSLVVRIPHKVRNCSLTALRYIMENGAFLSTLIISPPGAGKTTFLRDLLFQLSLRNICFNALVLDERGEIAGGEKTNLLESNFCDVLSFVSKPEGFVVGIRALSPSIVVCDELGTKEDCFAVEYAGNCGVGVVATIHAKNLLELKQKPNFESVLQKKIFKRFVVLSCREGPGTLEAIYDENFQLLLKGEK